MAKALNSNKKKIISIVIQPVRARVTDIRSHLVPAYQKLINFEIKDLMVAEFLGIEDMGQANRYNLTDQGWGLLSTRWWPINTRIGIETSAITRLIPSIKTSESLAS
ncbi:hypothetical protein NGC53_03260 [Aerococcus viridans]|uniref:hypothetical protein n=1 Tax=Aerococcus viridans TaxID=1377 RepID=UPI002DC038CC|nr:hypothetical protein [Aerococcus viridans]MEB7388815.1 hypothetical protein [Aerococcus viridans]